MVILLAQVQPGHVASGLGKFVSVFMGSAYLTYKKLLTV